VVLIVLVANPTSGGASVATLPGGSPSSRTRPSLAESTSRSAPTIVPAKPPPRPRSTSVGGALTSSPHEATETAIGRVIQAAR
jgi:hypothetical protein